jgi:hypothetical protein
MPQHGHAIELRQIQIEDHQVVVKLTAERARLLPILDHVYRVVFPQQSLAHKTGQCRIIFRYQNPHKWALITKRF